MRLITFQPHKKLIPVDSFVIFLAAIFLVLFADSIMSYYFPIAVENTANSNTIVGIVMALSSITGLACDLIFPQLFQKRSWKFLLISGIILSITFPITTNLGIAFSSVIVFILAAILWGIYFEFLSFSQQNFVVSTENRDEFTRDWGLVSIFWGIGMLVGPIVGSIIIHNSLVNSATIVVAIQFLSLIFALLLAYTQKTSNKSSVEGDTQMSISKELIYWFVLIKRIWPPILVGIIMTCVNATFWTLGALFGEKILGAQGLDWMVIVIYVLPTIPGAIILSKLKVKEHKKLFSEIALLFAGLCMSFMFFTQSSIFLSLFLILLISFFLAFCWPLNESVYSDLTDRAGNNRLHVTAITRANSSVGYIFAPLIAGILADQVGYYKTFSIIGLFVLVVASLLIIFTPRKIKLPQKEMETLHEE